MVGLVLALLVEALLVLVVLTLGSAIDQHKAKTVTMTSIAFRETPAKKQSKDEQEEAKAPQVSPAERPTPRQAATQPAQATPAEPAQPPPPALIQISPKEMASSNIAAPPKAPGPVAVIKRGTMGPVDTGGATAYADTARVGTAPNGQPLYAAAWVREPYDDEMAGYLQTATGPGWGLIACRTVPDFRVEDCVKLDEYPTGSNIARAALGAAWQYKVRPPRLGGVYKVGEWVRIKIEYGTRRKPGP